MIGYLPKRRHEAVLVDIKKFAGSGVDDAKVFSGVFIYFFFCLPRFLNHQPGVISLKTLPVPDLLRITPDFNPIVFTGTCKRLFTHNEAARSTDLISIVLNELQVG